MGSVFGFGDAADIHRQIHHFLFRDGDGVLLPDHGGDALGAAVFLGVLAFYHVVQEAVVAVQHLILEQTLCKKLEVGDEADIVHVLLVQCRVGVTAHDGGDFLNQFQRFGRLIQIAVLQLAVDEMHGNGACFLGRELKAGLFLDELQAVLRGLVLLRVKGLDLAEQGVLEADALFQPRDGKADVVHQIQEHALVQLAVHQLLMLFQDAFGNFQIDLRHVGQQRVALGADGLVLGYELLDDGRQIHALPGLLFEADAAPEQDALLPALVDSADRIVVDDIFD